MLEFVLAHKVVLVMVCYELWSLIPESKVKSSSLLTLLGNALATLKSKVSG